VSELVAAANGYIVRAEPWVMARESRDAELDGVLAALARCLFRLAVMTHPFMPAKSADLWQALGRPGAPDAGAFRAIEQPPVAGCRTAKPPPLFPKPQPVSEA
jgi:methionyl-tRNA synthetase